MRHAADERISHLLRLFHARILLLTELSRPLAVFLSVDAEMGVELLGKVGSVCKAQCSGNVVHRHVVLQHFEALH